jgi:hypothetical protein
MISLWLLRIGLSLEIIGAGLLSLDIFNQQVRDQFERGSRLLVNGWYTWILKGSVGAIILAPLLFLIPLVVVIYVFSPQQLARIWRNPELLSNYGLPGIILDVYTVYYDYLNALHITSKFNSPIYSGRIWDILANASQFFSLFGEFFAILPYIMIVSVFISVIGWVSQPSSDWNELETIHTKVWYALSFLMERNWSVLLYVFFLPFCIYILALSIVVILPVLPVLFGFNMERSKTVSSGLRFSGLLYLGIGFIIQLLSTFI